LDVGSLSFQSRRLSHFVLIAIAACTLSGCWTADVRDALKEQAAAPRPTVVVTTVGRRSIPVIDDFTARTIGTKSIDIKARVEGVLEQVRFQPGTIVHAGDVLFVIEADQYKAALLAAQAGMLKAQADLKRARDQLSIDRAKADVASAQADLGKAQLDVRRLTPLAQQQAAPQQDLDNAIAAEKVAQARYAAAAAGLKDATLDSQTQLMQAQAAIEGARAQVRQAALNLGYTTIRAPVTGLIGLLKVDQGNLVGHGDATTLATLIAVDPMRVDFSLSEIDYLALMNDKYRTASEVLHLVLADNSVYPYAGRPTALNNQLDPQTGTVTVQAQFPNPAGYLRPGQFARVRATVEQDKNAIVVPRRAIVELQGTKTVRVVGKGNKVEVRTVALGPSYEEDYVVRKGLSPGDRVIVEGLQKAEPGAVVKPVEQTAALAK
jgi:membrane fusion protein, multidrug efflux system